MIVSTRSLRTYLLRGLLMNKAQLTILLRFQGWSALGSPTCKRPIHALRAQVFRYQTGQAAIDLSNKAILTSYAHLELGRAVSRSGSIRLAPPQET